MGVCNCPMSCCTRLYVHSGFAIILMGKRELAAVLSLSSKCLVIVVWLLLAMPWICLQFVIVVLAFYLILRVFRLGHKCFLLGSFTRTGLCVALCQIFVKSMCMAFQIYLTQTTRSKFWIIYFSKYPFSGLWSFSNFLTRSRKLLVWVQWTKLLFFLVCTHLLL